LAEPFGFYRRIQYRTAEFCVETCIRGVFAETPVLDERAGFPKVFYHEIGPPGEFSLASQLPGRHLFKIGGWMSLGSCLFRATLATGFMLLALPSQSFAQATIGGSAPTKLVEATVAKLPDAPQPPSDATMVNPLPQPFSTSQTDSAQDNPGSQSSAQQSAQKSQHDEAEEQLKQQERQRVMGVMATFNTTRNQDALPLSPGQKFRLFFKSSTDPWPFLLAGAVAGIGQADDSYPEWGQGAQGYAKRYGAAYTDAFIGNFFGNAVLPVLLKEDPRYFQKGTGSFTRRVLWAASSTFWCKRDNGKWGPNYANVGGNLIGSAISRAYYPAQYRTVSDTITDGLTVSLEGIVGAELIEFWPDIVRHYKNKQAEKSAGQAVQNDSQKAAQHAPESAPH
jgi:hypothetical protein